MLGCRERAPIQKVPDPVAFARSGLAAPEQIQAFVGIRVCEGGDPFFDVRLRRERDVETDPRPWRHPEEFGMIFPARLHDQGMGELAAVIDGAEPGAALEDLADDEGAAAPTKARGAVGRAEWRRAEVDHASGDSSQPKRSLVAHRSRSSLPHSGAGQDLWRNQVSHSGVNARGGTREGRKIVLAPGVQRS